MKLFYSLLFLGIASATYAQSDAKVSGEMKSLKHTLTLNDKSEVPEARPMPDLRGDSFWSSDFSDPSAWGTTYDETHTPTSIVWEIITDNTVAPVGGLNPMMLPTFDNGFAFINADVAGEGSVQDAIIHTVDPIDLSGVDAVSLEFNYVTRNFATTYSVVYSLDEGATWNSVSVPGTPAGNENSSNPDYALVNLTAEIANQPEVWIGFRYRADWGWFWAVDDAALVTPPDTYISLRNAYYDSWATINDPDIFNGLFGQDIDMVTHYEYSVYGADQVRPLSFTAEVANFGGQTQNDVTFNVTLTDPEGTPYTFSESIATLEPGEREFIVIQDVMPVPFNLDNPEEMPLLGTYTVSFEIEELDGEFFPEDNVVPNKTFSVDEEVMSHSAAASYGYSSNLAGANYEAVSRYSFNDDTQIDYIEFALTTGDVNPEDILFASLNLNVFTGSIYEGQEPPNDELVNLFEVDEDGNSALNYFITDPEIFNDTPSPADETNWVRVMFPDPIDVSSGIIYNAEVGTGTPPEGLSDFVWPLASGGNPVTSSHWFGPFDGAATSLFIGGTTYAIRLGFDGTVGTEASESVTFRLGQNYPNPTNGQETLIDWELLEPAKNVTFTVYDMNGRVVDQRKLGDRPAGVQETIRLNADLAAGVYQYSLAVGNRRAVRKMVVTK